MGWYRVLGFVYLILVQFFFSVDGYVLKWGGVFLIWKEVWFGVMECFGVFLEIQRCRENFFCEFGRFCIVQRACVFVYIYGQGWFEMGEVEVYGDCGLGVVFVGFRNGKWKQGYR